MLANVADPTPLPRPLSSLRPGAHATVESRLVSGADGELLAAMGLTDRCRLRVCRIGEPCIVQVGCTRLGLPAAIAGRVLVRLEAAAS